MNCNNIIKVMKIKRDSFTQYCLDVRSTIAIPDYQSHIPDEFVAATLANNIREFVNSSVLDKHVETEYRELEEEWTCPCCGQKVIE